MMMSGETWSEPEGRNLGSDDDYFMAHLCVEPGIEDGPHNPDQCIVCGKPRDGGRIWCGDKECLEIVKKIPTAKLNAIRQREALAAMRKSPAPVDGSGVYIHMTPREE
jgi:predicted nucleic acid-binding Zn ribbon protein